MRCEEDTLLNKPKSQTNPYIYWLRCREQIHTIKKSMKVGQFETMQMLEGARSFLSLNRNEKELLFKIIDFLMRRKEVFELNEDDVYPAYDFICERISHCTRERDMKSSKFNPKTYEHLLLLKDAIRYNHPYTIVKNY